MSPTRELSHFQGIEEENFKWFFDKIQIGDTRCNVMEGPKGYLSRVFHDVHAELEDVSGANFPREGLLGALAQPGNDIQSLTRRKLEPLTKSSERVHYTHEKLYF